MSRYRQRGQERSDRRPGARASLPRALSLRPSDPSPRAKGQGREGAAGIDPRRGVAPLGRLFRFRAASGRWRNVRDATRSQAFRLAAASVAVPVLRGRRQRRRQRRVLSNCLIVDKNSVLCVQLRPKFSRTRDHCISLSQSVSHRAQRSVAPEGSVGGCSGARNVWSVPGRLGVVVADLTYAHKSLDVVNVSQNGFLM